METYTSHIVLRHNKAFCLNSHRVLVNKLTQWVRDNVAQRVEPSPGMREDPGSSLGEDNFSCKMFFFFSSKPYRTREPASASTFLKSVTFGS